LATHGQHRRRGDRGVAVAPTNSHEPPSVAGQILTAEHGRTAAIPYFTPCARESCFVMNESKLALVPSPDPFDPAALRLTQDFGGIVGVKKELTTVRLKRPGKQTWFRTHPSPEYRISPLATIQLKVRWRMLCGGSPAGAGADQRNHVRHAVHRHR